MAMDYFGQDDRLLANLPLFHVSGAGAVMDRLTRAARACSTTASSRSRSGTRCVASTSRAVASSGDDAVPAQSTAEQRAIAIHPLRAVITVPWNQDSLAVAERFGIDMHTAFNMTELATPIRSKANPPLTRNMWTGAARCRLPRRRRERHRSAAGTVGELIVRTSRPWEISQGYYKNPEATARAWRNGWFHTGDGFRCDDARATSSSSIE
jgi:crotonobetaine/carnitine-CoA ligase